MAVAKADKTLQKMRNNQRSDWSLSDVERVCRRLDIEVVPPRGGSSHYSLKHPAVIMILTIPKDKPIVFTYIVQLTKFIDSIEMSIKSVAQGEAHVD